MTRPFAFISRHASWLGAFSCVSAAMGLGAVLDGYSHTQHPFALLGASGVGATKPNPLNTPARLAFAAWFGWWLLAARQATAAGGQAGSVA